MYKKCDNRNDYHRQKQSYVLIIRFSFLYCFSNIDKVLSVYLFSMNRLHFRSLTSLSEGIWFKLEVLFWSFDKPLGFLSSQWATWSLLYTNMVSNGEYWSLSQCRLVIIIIIIISDIVTINHLPSRHCGIKLAYFGIFHFENLNISFHKCSLKLHCDVNNDNVNDGGERRKSKEWPVPKVRKPHRNYNS